MRALRRGCALLGVLLAGTPGASAALAAPAEGPAKPGGAVTQKVEVGAYAGSAFELAPAARDNPYGPRPSGVPRLSRDQIASYAVQNPAVKAADERITAMKQQLRKVKWGWLPIINLKMTLSPGANIVCDDVNGLTDANGNMVDFQWCRSGQDEDLDLNKISDYFEQLGNAGIRFAIDGNIIFPLTGFGKGLAYRDMARQGVALRTLQREQVKAQTLLLVHQAHASLLVAREAIHILNEAKGVADKARERIEKDLGDPDDFAADPSEGNPDRDPDDAHRVALTEVKLEELMREARKTEALALGALWALAGEAAPRGFDVKEDRLAPSEVIGGLEDLKHYKDLAVRERPEARLAAGAVKLREAQEKLARRNFLPDLALVLSYGYAVSTAADPDMSQLYYRDRFNYSRIIPSLALTWRGGLHFDAFDLRKAQAELRAADYERKAANLLLGRDVEQAYLELQEAGYQREQYARATDLAWKLVVSQEQRDMVGGGNSKELLKALADWYDWRFKHAEATLAYNVALARLSRAVGTALVAPQKDG